MFLSDARADGGASRPCLPASGADRGRTAEALQPLRSGCVGRSEIEDFVRGVYARRYGARVRGFAPSLVGLRSAGGSVVAAAGYRAAGESPLFLERYLGRPVEEVLAARAGRAVPRAAVVEVGHLAADRAGEGRRLIGLLGPHLEAQGYTWAVCTITRELRHLFVRLGVESLSLGPADAGALGPDAADWGRYYDHHPQVMAGHLPGARSRLPGAPR